MTAAEWLASDEVTAELARIKAESEGERIWVVEQRAYTSLETHEELMAGVERISRQIFTEQWLWAREAGLTEEEIAEIWAKRSIKPPEDWSPPRTICPANQPAIGEKAG